MWGMPIGGFCKQLRGGSPSEDTTQAPGETYTVQLAVTSPADLPKCTPALWGTVAYVTSTSSLYVCTQGNEWSTISCTVTKPET